MNGYFRNNFENILKTNTYTNIYIHTIQIYSVFEYSDVGSNHNRNEGGYWELPPVVSKNNATALHING